MLPGCLNLHPVQYLEGLAEAVVRHGEGLRAIRHRVQSKKRWWERGSQWLMTRRIGRVCVEFPRSGAVEVQRGVGR